MTNLLSTTHLDPSFAMSTKPGYAEWEPHKGQIEQIYLHENKTQKELGQIMKQIHRFQKTNHLPLALFFALSLFSIYVANMFPRKPSVSNQFHITSSSYNWTFAIRVEKEPDPLTGFLAIMECHQLSQIDSEQFSSDNSTESHHARRV